MIEDQVLQPDGPLLVNVALGLYEENPRDAVATLDALRPPATAAEALLDLFDQVPDAPADVRDDLLTRALARAREVDEPARRVALTARVADRWFEAGEPEKARPLLDEARAAFKSLGLGRRARRPRRPRRRARAGRPPGGPGPAGAGEESGASRGALTDGRIRRSGILREPGSNRGAISRASPAGPRRTTRPAPSGSSPGSPSGPSRLERAGRSLRRDGRAATCRGRSPWPCGGCAGGRGPDGRGGGQEQGVGRPGRGEDAAGRGV